MEIQGTKIDKLVVAGCSFSDYAKVDKNYSEHLSEILKIKHTPNYTCGGGSNFRMWRKILSGIRNKEILPNSLLVIQYTDVSRKEFWSCFELESERNGNPDKGSYMRENFKRSGQTIKYKYGSWGWQSKAEEVLLFKLMEENFTDTHYDYEVFENNHFSLCTTLEFYKINTIFIESQYCTKLKVPNGMYLHKYTTPKNYPRSVDMDLCLTNEDCAHLSESGHLDFAKRLANFIDEKINVIK